MYPQQSPDLQIANCLLQSFFHLDHQLPRKILWENHQKEKERNCVQNEQETSDLNLFHYLVSINSFNKTQPLYYMFSVLHQHAIGNQKEKRLVFQNPKITR
jgi:hypothetical protein